MDDFLPYQFTEAVQDLPGNVEHFVLFELAALHELLQITVLAELGDDVETVFGAEDVFELDDVGVVEPFQQVDL